MKGPAGDEARVRGGYFPSFDKAPFVFASAGARALPGPILIELMTAIEGTEAANKAVVHRMVEYGALTLERRGRWANYRMSASFRADFEALRDAVPAPWDGLFHTLIYDVPETRRRERDRLLSHAGECGYRLLRPGVLISPHDMSAPLAGHIAELSLITAWTRIDAEHLTALVERCWQLTELRAEYAAIIDQLALTLHDPQTTGPRALRALHAVIRPTAALLIRSGRLPRDLLPVDWPADRLFSLVGAAYGSLMPVIAPWVREVIAMSPYADEVEHEPDIDT